MARTAASAGETSERRRHADASEENVQVREPGVPEISASRRRTMSHRVSKKRVLIIVENQMVPFDRRVWREAASLRKNGYEVTVLCPRRKADAKGYEVIDGIRVYRHPSPAEGSTPMGYLWEYACALFWEFLYTSWIYLRHGFDVIQGCNPPDDIFLVAMPFKLLGVKYIFDQHDANPELYVAKYGKGGVLYRILVGLEKLSFRFSEVVMATNMSYKELAVTRGGVASENVFIVRNGPERDTFKSVAANPAWKNGKNYLVGYVGNMSTQDGLDILLDIAQYTKSSGRGDIFFTCVGEGTELNKLKKIVEDRDLFDTVRFTGRVSDEELLEILSTADICVNPDRPSEMNDISTMIKIMEYMALGKPIVQFDAREGRFSAQEASLYAGKEEGVADFAAKIIWLLDRPEERKKMGEFGRKRIEEQLAWEYSVPHLLAAYQKTLDGSHQGD
jgi:glycosyltransferase involved in cell wall biosynthesis